MSQPVPQVFAVMIAMDGTIAVNGTRVAPGDLTRLAKDARAQDPDVRAVIHADRSASWGSVVMVIDLVKQGGIAKLAFAVSPMAPPPAATKR